MSDYSRAGATERRPPGDLSESHSRGVRSLTAILPNGRVVWLDVDSPLAHASGVAHLAQLAEHSARWQGTSVQAQSDAVDRLSRTIVDDVERTTNAHIDRVRAMSRRIVAANDRLDRKLSKAVEDYRSRVERQLGIEREAVRRLNRRDLWDKVVLVTSAHLFATYGERGRPFGANNLALTLSLLIWLVGDEIVDALFGSEESSPYPLKDTGVWSYLAPVGNLLAGWWLLSDRQHERFVAGRATITANRFKTDPNPPPDLLYRYTAEVDLSTFIAPDHLEEFQAFKGVPVVATISSIELSAIGNTANVRIRPLTAEVVRKKLIVTFRALAVVPAGPVPSILDKLEVAWMVDTQKPSTVPAA